MAITNIFGHTKVPKQLSKYTLSRGVSDFSNMAQWNRFEKGYYFLTVVDIPYFLKILAQNNAQYSELISEYVHCLEYEFKGFSGLDDITSETGEINDGISTINMINKVVMQSASTITMNYSEKSGGLFTKVHELFLRGVKDPRTQVKRYAGLIEPGIYTGNDERKINSIGDGGIISSVDAGFEMETFKFLIWATDNTALNVERAFYLVGAQPTKAEISTLYQGDKGNYEFPEISIQFSGFPITGPKVDETAKNILYAIQTGSAESNPNKLVVDSNEFDYNAFGGSDSTIAETTLNSYNTTADTNIANKDGKDRFNLSK